MNSQIRDNITLKPSTSRRKHHSIRKQGNKRVLIGSLVVYQRTRLRIQTPKSHCPKLAQPDEITPNRSRHGNKKRVRNIHIRPLSFILGEVAGTNDAIAVEVDRGPIRMSNPPSVHHGGKMLKMLAFTLLRRQEPEPRSRKVTKETSKITCGSSSGRKVREGGTRKKESEKKKKKKETMSSHRLSVPSKVLRLRLVTAVKLLLFRRHHVKSHRRRRRRPSCPYPCPLCHAIRE